MSLRLIVMRHAKSSWKQKGLSDHARPLNKRGTRSAVVLGDWLRAQGYSAAEGLSSDARRTRQTWEGLALDAPAHFLPSLYLAMPEGIEEVLRRHAQARTVLVLGHNPGIGAFAGALVASPPAHPRFADYPTGATLVADLPVADWSQLKPGQGRAVDFIVPRDLTG